MSNQMIFGLLVIAFSVWYLSHQAGRLDRLHHRIDVAELALHGQLVRRGGIVAELAAVPGIVAINSTRFFCLQTAQRWKRK